MLFCFRVLEVQTYCDFLRHDLVFLFSAGVSKDSVSILMPENLLHHVSPGRLSCSSTLFWRSTPKAFLFYLRTTARFHGDLKWVD